jgi:hypothetical protein
MRLVAIGLGIGILLVGFVTVWVYMASQGMVPSIGGQLQGVPWFVRFVVLVLLVAVVGGLFALTRKRSS